MTPMVETRVKPLSFLATFSSPIVIMASGAVSIALKWLWMCRDQTARL
jgi:hypothetical protein